MLVAGTYLKRRGEGGHWGSERRLIETTVTTTEIFEETQGNHWPIHCFDVLQAETWLWQSMDFLILETF